MEDAPPNPTRLVTIDAEIHSGDPVFAGTRVPVETFIERLCGGVSVDEFVDHFPSVRREQAIAFLHAAAEALIARECRNVETERNADRG